MNLEKKMICLLLEVYNNSENYPIDEDVRDPIFQVAKEYAASVNGKLRPMYDGEQIGIEVGKNEILTGFPLRD